MTHKNEKKLKNVTFFVTFHDIETLLINKGYFLRQNVTFFVTFPRRKRLHSQDLRRTNPVGAV